MIRVVKFILLILILLPFQLTGGTLLDSLTSDIEDGSLNHFSLPEAAFIISGVSTAKQLQDNMSWFQSIIADIEEKRIVDTFERVESAQKMFLYFHTTWLQDYKEQATTLLNIRRDREFNCVSATILYNLTCDEFGLSTMAFETPTHVYTIFTNFSENIMVENTTSIGFNIIKNLDDYSRYMARYYPKNQMYKIGLHRLYAYENSRGRRISNVELLGLISYNQAYFASKESRYAKAYDYVVLAQLFNQDSRSNQRFEISLYYKWGDHLYKNGLYPGAFEVFADAVYRYPDNEDFANNCIISFYKSSAEHWQMKDWDSTATLFEEILYLEILQQKDIKNLEKMLTDWTMYSLSANKKDQCMKVIEFQKERGLNKKQHSKYEKILDSIH